MSLPPPLPNRTKSMNDWRAVLVTLAYPGTGQFLQGRRTVAYVLTTITTLVFLWGVGAILYGFITSMRESWETGGTSNFLAHYRHVVLPVKMLGLCYLVCFVDAVIAHFRKRRTTFESGPTGS